MFLLRKYIRLHHAIVWVYNSEGYSTEKTLYVTSKVFIKMKV